MKTVAWFLTYYEVESGFSLVSVTETQLRMAMQCGYMPRVLVQEGMPFEKEQDGKSVTVVQPFREAPLPSVWNQSSLDLRPVVPALHLSRGVHPEFDERVEQYYQVMVENLVDVDVILTHDLVLQPDYKEANIAMRRFAQQYPDKLWLHWIHSRPAEMPSQSFPDCCRFMMPPGYIVYPNTAEVGEVSRTYSMGGQEHRIIVNRTSHSIDPLLLWRYDELTLHLARKSGLHLADVGMVYPCRTEPDKQIPKLIYLAAGVKRARYRPCLLVIDWQSTGKRFLAHKDYCKQLASKLHVEDCVFFASELDNRAYQGVPRDVVFELMSLSNVYSHPSKSETYSLTTHEGMLQRNLLALNHDLPQMYELFGNHAMYFDFGSWHNQRSYRPSEARFWEDEAKRLIADLQHKNRSLWAATQARAHWSPEAMAPEFEALFYLDPADGALYNWNQGVNGQ